MLTIFTNRRLPPKQNGLDGRVALIKSALSERIPGHSIFCDYLYRGYLDSAESYLRNKASSPEGPDDTLLMKSLLTAFKGDLFLKIGNRDEAFALFAEALNSDQGDLAAVPTGFFLERPFRITRITSNSYAERYPHYSPDNSRIVYVADNQEVELDDGMFTRKKLFRREIRILDTWDNRDSVISPDDAKAIYNYTRFSPDGKHIIYTVNEFENGLDMQGLDYPGIIETICLDSAPPLPRNIPGNIRGRNPVLIADSMIVFSYRGINILDLKNNNLRSSPYYDELWPFGIDFLDCGGRFIVFRGFSHIANRWHIYLTDFTFDTLKIVTEFYDKACFPALSTHQDILAYIKQTDRGDDVYFYLLEQQSHLRITDSGGIKAYLSFSPDGTRLLYVQKLLNSTDAYYDIYSIDLNRFWTAGELMQYLDSINVNDYE